MPSEPNSKIDYLEIKFSNQRIHQDRGNHYEDIANDIFVQLTRLLISLNIFLLTFTSPIFIQIKEMTELDKSLLFIGWIFLLVSIFAGIVQLVVERKFYDKLAKYYYSIAGLYSLAGNTEDELEKVEKEKAVETQSNFQLQSSIVPFAIQTFCFIVGLIFILTVFHSFLF